MVLSFRKILITCCLCILSFQVFAETYPGKDQMQTRTYGNAGWANFVSKDNACKLYNYYIYYATYNAAGDNCAKHYSGEGSFSIYPPTQTVYTCPGGGTLSGSSCTGAPDCVAPQLRHSITKLCTAPPVCKSAETLTPTETSWTCVQPVCTTPQINDVITGACIVPYNEKPTCVIPEDPLKADCQWPHPNDPSAPDPINCVDGSTVYVPVVCPVNKWNPFEKPGPGESGTCANGQVVGYPDSCIKRYFDRILNDGSMVNVGVMALGSGLPGSGLPKPVLKVVNNLLTGLPEVRAIMPIAAKINTAGTSAYASIDTSIPTISVGKAIAEYLKSTPGSSYGTALIAAVAAGAAGMQLYQDANTGDLMPVGSIDPLSSNQIADLAMQTNHINPIPITEISPFVQFDNIPWLEPAIHAIEGDFTRVYDPAGQQAPLNFPGITPNSPFISPVYDPGTSSIASVGPESPTQYQQAPAPTPSTQTSPTVNSNPTGTDAPTSPVISPNPETPIDPTSVELPPTPPTIYPDTWKYFDFLPMANPFVFNISNYLPQLPETTCFYEVHRTFHVPFLGEKHFDFAPCAPLQPLRVVLDWVFAVITAWVCFSVIFRSTV